MVIFKEISLLLGLFIYILVGLMLHGLLFFLGPSIRLRIISHWTRAFNRFLRLILNIKVIIQGDSSLLKEGGNFIISNHLSYLDGVVLGSLFTVVYTSKIQVKSWPIFGWMTRIGGTIFIDRLRKGKVSDYIQKTQEMLKRKINVLVFPEGTSSNGQSLLSFQTIHFQSPLLAKSPILPVTLIYTKVDKEEFSFSNRDRVCWYGQIKLLPHLLRLLEIRNIEIKVVLHPKIDLADFNNDDYSRKTLSQSLHQIIAREYPLFKE